MNRETALTRKRLNEMAKISGEMTRQLQAMLGEIETIADEFPQHAEASSAPLTRSITALAEFSRAVAL